jgi:type IV pilus assembly protein PilC
MGVSPIGLNETVAGTGLNREINIAGLSKGVGLKDLAIMSRQAATMVSAGLSLLARSRSSPSSPRTRSSRRS